MGLYEFLDTLDFDDEPYKFPYEEYRIVGDVAEIDNIINTCGYINIDVRDIEKVLLKDGINYVSTGTADGANSYENALEDALSKLPIPIDRIYNLLINICISNVEYISNMMSMIDFTYELLPVDTFVIWGCAIDESLRGKQVEVSLIAASK